MNLRRRSRRLIRSGAGGRDERLLSVPPLQFRGGARGVFYYRLYSTESLRWPAENCL